MKNNLYKLSEYLNSLRDLEHMKIDNDTKEITSKPFLYNYRNSVHQYGFIINYNIYFMIKHKICKTINAVEQNIECKIYDTISTSHNETLLPRIS